jgi:ribosomal protein S18 acetylase RimI-like enzyme
VSWFRSSRRRRKEEAPETEGATGAREPEVAVAPGEPAGNGSSQGLPRAELLGRPLADLHELAREHGVPGYRLLRKEELIGALAGGGPPDIAPAREAAAPAIAISEVEGASVEVLEAVQQLVHQLSSTASAPGASDLEEIVGSPSTRLLVARGEEGKIVGMLTLALYRIPSGVCAWIEDVVVDERARRHGTGEALTREALRFATEAGAGTVDLTSRQNREEANRLYRKLGFKRRETNLYRFEP